MCKETNDIIKSECATCLWVTFTWLSYGPKAENWTRSPHEMSERKIPEKINGSEQSDELKMTLEQWVKQCEWTTLRWIRALSKRLKENSLQSACCLPICIRIWQDTGKDNMASTLASGSSPASCTSCQERKSLVQTSQKLHKRSWCRLFGGLLLGFTTECI